MARPPVLELRGVWRSYAKGRVPVLRGLDLAVAPGELVVVRGPSGSGKSTLLHLAGLMDAPDEGVVLHGGREVATRPERERAAERLRGIGFVFQRAYLVPTLTALENVALPMKAVGLPADEAAARATQLLDVVRLGERARHYPHELSGGQQQMAAVARALANRPPLVLADEPTGELDPESGRRVMGLLAEAHGRGVAIVLVTHAPDLAPPGARHVRLVDGVALPAEVARA